MKSFKYIAIFTGGFKYLPQFWWYAKNAEREPTENLRMLEVLEEIALLSPETKSKTDKKQSVICLLLTCSWISIWKTVILQNIVLF